MCPRDGFRELARHECLDRLGRAPIGRVVHTRGALPAVLPVNFTLDTDSAVLLRMPADSELAQSINGVVVAFEADAVDPGARSGWTVVVTGYANVIDDPAVHDHLTRTGPRSWGASPEDVFIRIASEMITGRELVGGRVTHGVEAPDGPP
ncbi:pyridoxamine 5'-phosphate oxidase family protein [Streptomyces sp. NPDC006640]|uniref:pyridoxamine 5'-phosphate oxidase family protein n=1 Tax=unclassified Streptomyces TaxID=2593676 RepID=UPI0036D1319B